MILFFTLIVSYDWSSSNRIFTFAIIKSIMSHWIKNTIWIHRFAFVVVVIVAIKLSSSFVDCKLFSFISYGYQNVALDKMYYTPSNVGFNAPFFFIIECVCMCMCARLCDTHSHNTVSNSIIIYHDCDDDGVDVDDPRSISITNEKERRKKERKMLEWNQLLKRKIDRKADFFVFYV